MNIILRELRANLRSLVIWCASMAALIAVGMVKYGGVAGAGPSAYQLIEQMPQAMKSIMELNLLDITTVAGYYGVFFLYLMLLAGIHAVMLGAAIISKEERDKTADFLFVKPVVRSRIITAKLIAALINLSLFNLVTLAASVYFVAQYNTGPSINDQIAYLMVSLFILQVIFAAIGAGISGITRNSRKAASLSTTLFLFMFFLSMAIELYRKIDFLKYLTPFRYFPIAQVMQGSFDTLLVVLSLLITTIFVAITYQTFQKRDLHI